MSVLRDIINTVDTTQGVTAEVKENLHILMDLADSKVKLFSDNIVLSLKNGKIAGLDDLDVPVTKVTHKYMESRAYTSESTTDLMEKVTEVIGSMITEPNANNIVNGIGKMAKNMLDAVMGTGEGTEREATLYAVAVDYPVIVRLDFSIWGRKIQAESIKKYCEMAFACVAYKSAVDLSKLKFNDFLALYGPVLKEMCNSDMRKMKEFIDEAEEIYNRFRQEDGQNAAPLMVDADQAMKTVLANSQPLMIVSPSKKPEVGLF